MSVSDNNFIMLQQNIRLSGATVVVTGAAGFIGASLTERLLDFVKEPQEELVRAGVLPEDISNPTGTCTDAVRTCF